MFAVTASGKMLPPMVVYKSGTGSVYPQWCQDGPQGTVDGATISGWFTMSMFNIWFDKVALAYFNTLPKEDVKVGWILVLIV